MLLLYCIATTKRMKSFIPIITWNHLFHLVLINNYDSKVNFVECIRTQLLLRIQNFKLKKS